MKKIKLVPMLLLLLTLIGMGCGSEKKTGVATDNLWKLIQATPTLSTFESVLTQAGLDSDLGAESTTYTVLAPTNDAFVKLPAGTLESLLNDPKGELKNILLYHIIADNLELDKVVSDTILQAMNDVEIVVTVRNNGVAVNDVKLSVTPILATNGILFMIDTVLMPNARPLTLMQVVEKLFNHQTLTAALVATKLDDSLLDPTASFTLFAPNDAAFALLPQGVFNKLMVNPETDLKDILLYHLVDSKMLSGQLSEGKIITLLDGATVTITIKNGELYINNAKIAVKDIEASNGVVHTIDAVLLPELK